MYLNMLNIIPKTGGFSPPDYHPLHVYIIHKHGTYHLELTYVECDTYSVGLLPSVATLALAFCHLLT